MRRTVCADQVRVGDIMLGIWNSRVDYLTLSQPAKRVLEVVHDLTPDDETIVLLRTEPYGGPWVMALTRIEIERKE